MPAMLAAAGLAASFVYVQSRKAAAERDHPPAGKFVEVDGVRLHYIERGEGPALVLLHGNGFFADDFTFSGLLEAAAAGHRVIAFDRPGFGYSDRPGNTSWTPEAQARLIYQALHELRVERPIVVGHSLGTQVAMAMALDFPRYVRGIALIGGYFYPTPRLDTALLSLPAVPVLGHLWRYTAGPLVGRLMWPRLRRPNGSSGCRPGWRCGRPSWAPPPPTAPIWCRPPNACRGATPS
jgi:pimeloyl-ACP methyl ester carboxylesterase